MSDRFYQSSSSEVDEDLNQVSESNDRLPNQRRVQDVKSGNTVRTPSSSFVRNFSLPSQVEQQQQQPRRKANASSLNNQRIGMNGSSLVRSGNISMNVAGNYSGSAQTKQKLTNPVAPKQPRRKKSDSLSKSKDSQSEKKKVENLKRNFQIRKVESRTRKGEQHQKIRKIVNVDIHDLYVESARKQENIIAELYRSQLKGDCALEKQKIDIHDQNLENPLQNPVQIFNMSNISGKMQSCCLNTAFNISKLSLNLINLIIKTYESPTKIQSQNKGQIGLSLRDLIIEKIHQYKADNIQQIYPGQRQDYLHQDRKQLHQGRKCIHSDRKCIHSDRKYIEIAQKHILNLFKSGVWVDSELVNNTEIIGLKGSKKLIDLDVVTQQIELYSYDKQLLRFVNLDKVRFCPTYQTTGKFFSSIMRSSTSIVSSSIFKTNPYTAASADVLLYKILSDKIYAFRNLVEKAFSDSHRLSEIKDSHQLSEIKDSHQLSEIKDSHQLSEIKDWFKGIKLPPKLILVDMNSSSLKKTQLRIQQQCYELQGQRFISQGLNNQQVEQRGQVKPIYQLMNQIGINVVAYIKDLDQALQKYSVPFSLYFENNSYQNTSEFRQKQNISFIKTVQKEFKYVLYESNQIYTEKLTKYHLLNTFPSKVNIISIGFYDQVYQTHLQYLDSIQIITDAIQEKHMRLQQNSHQSQNYDNFMLRKIKDKFIQYPLKNAYSLSNFSIKKYFNSSPFISNGEGIINDMKSSMNRWLKDKLPTKQFSQDIFILATVIESQFQSSLNVTTNRKINLEQQFSIKEQQFSIKEQQFSIKDTKAMLFKTDGFSENFLKKLIEQNFIIDLQNNRIALSFHPKLMLEAIRSSGKEIASNLMYSNQLILDLLDEPTIIGCLFQKILIQMITIGQTRLVLSFGSPKIPTHVFQNISSQILLFIPLPIKRSLSSYQDYNILDSFWKTWNNQHSMKHQPCLFLPMELQLKQHSKNHSKNSKSIDFILSEYQSSKKILTLWMFEVTIQNKKIIPKISRFLASYIQLIQNNGSNKSFFDRWKREHVKCIKINYVVISARDKINLKEKQIKKQTKAYLTKKCNTQEQIKKIQQRLQSLKLSSNEINWLKVSKIQKEVIQESERGTNQESENILQNIGVISVQDFDLRNQNLKFKFLKRLLTCFLDNLQNNAAEPQKYQAQQQCRFQNDNQIGNSQQDGPQQRPTFNQIKKDQIKPKQSREFLNILNNSMQESSDKDFYNQNEEITQSVEQTFTDNSGDFSSDIDDVGA